jgi:Mannosyltransferase putative
MDMITAEEVIRRIELYFNGGAMRYLEPKRLPQAERAIAVTQEMNGKPFDFYVFRDAFDRVAKAKPKYPGGYRGKGIVICGGGRKYFPPAWVCINMLRRLGCKLPIELWHLGPGEMNDSMREWVRPLGVRCVDARAVSLEKPARRLFGWEVKPYAIIHSRFREVLFLDADNVPLVNPEFLFETPEYREMGAIFWPDRGPVEPEKSIWEISRVPYRHEPSFESGQIVVDKSRCWHELQVTMWMNEHSDYFYKQFHGDKETFHFAWRKLERPYAMPAHKLEDLQGVMCQHDFDGRRIFQHRSACKYTFSGFNRMVPGLLLQEECLEHVAELRPRWQEMLAASEPAKK